MSRIVVSNIAWEPADDTVVAAVLREHGVDGVELAPTKRWPDVTKASDEDARAWRAHWAKLGMRVTSLQSLLFGRPDLLVFGTPADRRALRAVMHDVFRIAGALGAGPLVFGSPSNRRRGSLSMSEATRIAIPVFTELAADAAAHGATLCIEPNPPQYACDFLTATEECVAFLEAADSPALGLHLDAAAMTLNEEDPDRAIELAAPWLRHYHASEPFLAPVERPTVPHGAHARALARIGYTGHVAIEMRPSPDVPAADHVRAALGVVVEAYARLLG
jgi:D-psicose/D-tagatose/L-ribulose 3-epimerase